MRIPFIPKVNDIEELRLSEDLFKYIRATKAGSSLIFAGALFWLVAALIGATRPEWQLNYIIYGGLSVPFMGLMIAKAQGAKLFTNARYDSLAAFAVLTELVALPVMIFLKDSQPEVLPLILMLMDGAHLVVYMWLHLDYYYFLAANAKIVIACLFMFGVIDANPYTYAVLASGITSVLLASLAWRDSSRTKQLYLIT